MLHKCYVGCIDFLCIFPFWTVFQRAAAYSTIIDLKFINLYEHQLSCVAAIHIVKPNQKLSLPFFTTMSSHLCTSMRCNFFIAPHSLQRRQNSSPVNSFFHASLWSCSWPTAHQLFEKLRGRMVLVNLALPKPVVRPTCARDQT